MNKRIWFLPLFSLLFSDIWVSSAMAAAPGVPAAPVAVTAPSPATPTVSAVASAPPDATSAVPPPAVTGGGDQAQNDGANDLPTLSQAQSKIHDAGVPPAADESLFFTPWQHALLQEAKRGFLTRPAGSVAASDQPAKPSIREISLDGIIYHGPKDWTIYLNQQRVTPNALPDQVMDLKVYNDYIDLKWFDTANNLIFPIRLRAHQRFNLDARMFLPGIGVETLSSTQ